MKHVARGAPLHVRSYAKVNLGLEVLGPREDGYHELRTLFQTIALHDDLSLRPARRSRKLRSRGVPPTPQPAARRAALRRFAPGRRREITIRSGFRSGGLRRQQQRAAPPAPPHVGLGRACRPHPWPHAGADCPFFFRGHGPLLGGVTRSPLHRHVSGHLVLVDPAPIPPPRIQPG